MLKLVANPTSPGTREFPLGPGTNYAGRGYSNDVKIEDPSVSTNHAQIIVENGRVIIKDLGSMNGTYINGMPVTEAVIHPGESIRLGAVELLFEDDVPAIRTEVVTKPRPDPVPVPPPMPAPELIDGIPIANPVVAEALRAARERLHKSTK